MRLAAKLLLLYFSTVVLMTAVGSYFSVRRGVERIERQQQQLAEATAAAIDRELAQAWRQGGAEAVLQAIDSLPTPSSQHHLRWVWFERTELTSRNAQSAIIERVQISGAAAASDLVADQDGTRRLRTYLPIDLGDAPRGGLEISSSLDAHDAEVRDTITIALISLGAMAFASIACVYFAGIRWVAAPLDELIAKTRRIAAGDFGSPLEVKGRDELAQLAQALNDMAKQLAAQQQRIQNESAGRLATLEQLRHADRLKTVGRLAAGIAHEMGTPLNVISGRAGLIASGKLSEKEIADSAQTITAETQRVTGIIRQLLGFARPSKSRRAAVDIGRLLTKTVELIEPLAEKRNVHIRTSTVDGLIVSADESQLQQVLTNLLVNAMQAMSSGGEVVVDSHSCEATPPGGASLPCIGISVRDQGAGIPQEELNQIFEPFFTTKDVGEGTGLGLSIAYGIVQEHGGWIDVASQPDRGSCFTVYLPRMAANSGATE